MDICYQSDISPKNKYLITLGDLNAPVEISPFCFSSAATYEHKTVVHTHLLRSDVRVMSVSTDTLAEISVLYRKLKYCIVAALGSGLC